MSNIRAVAIAQVLAHHAAIAGSLSIVDQVGNVFTVADIEGTQYSVTVETTYVPTDGPIDTETWQKCRDRDAYGSAKQHRRECGAHLMNNDDERDYEEEAANRALMEEHDDDGDDDEIPATPETFDGGYGQGSWFQTAMKKND